MAKVKDVIAYFCLKYPHSSELSKARLTKMVYLADWKSAIDRGKQITDVEWIFNHYGPYVDDVYAVALSDSAFEVEISTNMHGGDKEVIGVKSKQFTPDLTNAETQILDHIIKITAPRYWNNFMELVYSTYPIRKSDRYDTLNLVSLANEYELEQLLS